MFYKIYEIIYSEILLNKITSPLDEGDALIGQHIPAHSFLESLLFQCDETDPIFANKN